MKKRIILIITLLVFFCVACLAYYLYPYREKRFGEAFNIKISEITKIKLVYFSSTVTIEGNEKINEFIKIADSDIVKKEKGSRGKGDHGWEDSIIFYSGDKVLKELVFKTDIENLEDHKFYEIVRGDLNQKKIVELINMEVNEK